MLGYLQWLYSIFIISEKLTFTRILVYICLSTFDILLQKISIRSPRESVVRTGDIWTARRLEQCNYDRLVAVKWCKVHRALLNKATFNIWLVVVNYKNYTYLLIVFYIVHIVITKLASYRPTKMRFHLLLASVNGTLFSFLVNTGILGTSLPH